MEAKLTIVVVSENLRAQTKITTHKGPKQS